MRDSLINFANKCEEKLKKNDHKSDWRTLPVEALVRKLEIEIEEFKVALQYEGVEDARNELVDVANFAMMLWDRMSIPGRTYEMTYEMHGQWMHENKILSYIYRCSDGEFYYEDVPEARDRGLRILPPNAKV